MGRTKKIKLLNLTDKDLELINSSIGMRYLFTDKKTNVIKALRMTEYEYAIRHLQTELIKLQNWAIEKGKKIILVYEGRDAASKGGAIRSITDHINPRFYRIAALPRPTFEETGQWYFQRYVKHFPKPGEIVLFDRSWYNRAVVEPVNGFCTPHQYEVFMGQVNDFERMIVESDIYLIKFYFSITKEEQARRFLEIKSSRLKRWKMTEVDERAQDLWDEYTKYKIKMFERTDVPLSPWIIINADIKTEARIQSLQYILDHIPYQKK